MPKISYRNYDPSLNEAAVEVLYDVDEYYPDLLATLDKVEKPLIFITGWLMVPWIGLTSSATFESMLVRQVQDNDATVRILWNTNITGPPQSNLVETAEKLYRKVIGARGAADDPLRIILSTNVNFTVSLIDPAIDFGLKIKRLLDGDDIADAIQASLRSYAHELWLKSFPGDPQQYGAMTEFTLGSHHQKTVSILGKDKTSHEPVLYSYCGGLDFSTGTAGCTGLGAPHHGGKWWCDSTMRVRGDGARGVLENFVDRWNEEIDRVANEDLKPIAFGRIDNDELDVDELYEDQNDALGTDIETARTISHGLLDVHLFAWGRDRLEEIKEVYLDLIGEAEQMIYIENQYFRHPDIAEALVEALNDHDSLRVTIVVPSYTEELGTHSEFMELRHRFAATESEVVRAGILERVRERERYRIDPINKLTVLMQTRCLEQLVNHGRVRIWIPQQRLQGKFHGHPYIHSKLMVVDDKALTVGSANLNGRSLDGRADTEINLVLTNREEVIRIRDRIGWFHEPENDQNASYAGSWYAKHHLVRYTPRHHEFDAMLGSFPRGRDKILKYFSTFKRDERVEKAGITLTPAQIGDLLDSAPSILDLENAEWEDWLIWGCGHLL